MKYSCLLFALTLIYSNLLLSQATPRITNSFNDISYLIAGNGVISFDAQNNLAAYRVPKMGSANPLYYMNAMVLGKDVNDQVYAALGEYSTTDFSSGPLADDYDAEYLSRYNQLWSISDGEIQYHIEHYMEAGYTAPPKILVWPGNGNVENGEAAILAPFVDINTNGIYEPLQGDYPDITGDFAIYSIINDQRIAGPYGQQRPGVEIHLMYYVYATDNALNKVSFVHATVYNRSVRSYSDFQYGALVDFDLGNYNDDYLGTSIGKNAAFVYNGDDNDEGTGGYGMNPPAFGVVALNGDLYSNARNADNITQISRFVNLMSGLLPDGSEMTDENGDPTRYAYATSNTENSLMNPPGDRRSLISFTPQSLPPFSHLCYDYALVYAREANSGPFYSVDTLLSTVDFVQEFYNEQNVGCGNGTLSLTENSDLAIKLYPNPVNGPLSVKGISNAEFILTGTDGRVYGSGMTTGIIDVSALSSGMYILTVKENGRTLRKSFIKE